MTKALFFDIDGTLISFKTHSIPQSTIEALNLAKEKGHKLFISTGRARMIIDNLGDIDFDGYITMNGSYCFADEQEIIYKSSIPRKDVETLAYIVDKEQIPCVFVEETQMSICNGTPEIDNFYRQLNITPFPSITIEEAVAKEMFQITPFITVEQEAAFMPLLTHCEAGRWFPTFVDIVAKDNSKQRGIDEIIRHFNFDLKDTMSFGDGGNDISMLRHAAIGVAMGNAEDHVKQFADHVTDSVDEDGIWNALKHFGII